MQDLPVPESSDKDKKEEGAPSLPPDLHAEEDGRNREWEDRARVNLERVPDGTHTNLERDFEPEQPAPQPPDHPAY
ncbi:MAG: hypothetical protein INR73_25570 [Williamsia sp.]|nr:hypothetical protein [Williamsia sp.]